MEVRYADSSTQECKPIVVVVPSCHRAIVPDCVELLGEVIIQLEVCQRNPVS